jgi:mono/diheme cytochrome c family protein
MRRNLAKILPLLLISTLAAVVFMVTANAMDAPVAYALPVYSVRTGEPCATCHANPGGGGPRTLRGLLWSARGRPDEVPELSGVLLAPGITEGVDLFDIACAPCHGLNGEGLFGNSLANTGLPANKIHSAVVRGRLRSGMPAYEDKLTESQIEVLVSYVEGMANGTIELPPTSYSLPEGELTCQPQTAAATCGGN